MLLDLKPILVTPGASLPFETREDLSDLVFGSCKPASKPVLAYGKVRNTAGVLELPANSPRRCTACATAAPASSRVRYRSLSTLFWFQKKSWSRRRTSGYLVSTTVAPI